MLLHFLQLLQQSPAPSLLRRSNRPFLFILPSLYLLPSLCSACLTGFPHSSCFLSIINRAFSLSLALSLLTQTKQAFLIHHSFSLSFPPLCSAHLNSHSSFILPSLYLMNSLFSLSKWCFSFILASLYTLPPHT